MRDRANAGVAIGQLRVVDLEVVDELFQAAGGHGLLGHDRLRCVVDDPDLREARCRVVFEARIERGCRRLGPHIADRDGVTVRLGLDGAGHPDGPAGAADILDDDWLAERARHMLPHQAGDDVGRAAGRKRHDHGDRLVWILSSRRRGQQCERKEAAHDQTTQQQHPCPSLCRSQSLSHVRWTKPKACDRKSRHLAPILWAT